MTRLACLIAAGAAAVFAGCATPSVHPICTDETAISDPAVVGTWKPADSKETYTVTAAEDGYHLLVMNNDSQEPRKWEFAVRLTQIGTHRFADVSAPEAEREAVGEKWGPLFIPGHMFCRYALNGDTLEVRFLNRDWLRKSAAAGEHALASTPLDRDTTLITAETPQLRAFLEKHGGSDAAFADRTRLTRIPR